MFFWVRVCSCILFCVCLLCSLGFVYTCCVLWGSFVSVVFSGVYLYLLYSLGFVCNCCVLWGLFVSVVFSGVRLYLLCSLGFVRTCCVLWGSFVSVVFSGVRLYLLCSLGFVRICCVHWSSCVPIKPDFGRIVTFMQVGCALNRVISFTRHAYNRIWLEVALVSGIITYLCGGMVTVYAC